MRTTVILDPDLETLVREAMKTGGLSFEAALNAGLRTGLTQIIKARPFVQKTFSLGAEQNFRWDKALLASDLLSDQDSMQNL